MHVLFYASGMTFPPFILYLEVSLSAAHQIQ